MSDEHKFEIAVGDIVQLSPKHPQAAFRGCLLIVTEVKGFGCQGFVQSVGATFDEPGGQFYLRPSWELMEPTGGRARWCVALEDDN